MADLGVELWHRFGEAPGVVTADLRNSVERRARTPVLPLLPRVQRRWTVTDRLASTASFEPRIDVTADIGPAETSTRSMSGWIAPSTAAATTSAAPEAAGAPRVPPHAASVGTPAASTIEPSGAPALPATQLPGAPLQRPIVRVRRQIDRSQAAAAREWGGAPPPAMSHPAPAGTSALVLPPLAPPAPRADGPSLLARPLPPLPRPEPHSVSVPGPLPGAVAPPPEPELAPANAAVAPPPVVTISRSADDSPAPRRGSLPLVRASRRAEVSVARAADVLSARPGPARVRSEPVRPQTTQWPRLPLPVGLVPGGRPFTSTPRLSLGEDTRAPRLTGAADTQAIAPSVIQRQEGVAAQAPAAPASSPAAPLTSTAENDQDELVERVYRRLRKELTIARERHGGLAP